MKYIKTNSFVYAIGYPTDETNHTGTRLYHVKIGYSKDPQKRRSQLQVGNPNPLEILAMQCTGLPEDAEYVLKNRYADYAEGTQGEWFLFPESILESLNYLMDYAVVQAAIDAGVTHCIQTRFDANGDVINIFRDFDQ